MKRPLDVISIGRSSVDLYGGQVGGRLEDMRSFRKYIGGSPTNAAAGAARLGLKAAVITRVGDEHMGRFIREQLRAEGVDVRGVITDPERLTALVLLGIVFLRTRLKLLLTVVAAAALCAVGVFDALTWDGDLFHSYVTNLRFNLILGEMRTDESPWYQFLWWLTLSGAGLSALCLVGSLRVPRRYGLLLALIVLVLLAHSLQAHKEYRFVFAVIPLWLLLGADLVVRGGAWIARRLPAHPGLARATSALAGGLFAAVSLAGVLNSLPYQERVYQAWSRETGITGFVRNQDPIFAVYRYLSEVPDVGAVWQIDRPYFNLPGYYYLHRAVPFYDAITGAGINRDLAMVSSSASHLVSADRELEVPGYSLDREFGGVRILRRDAHEPPVRQWRAYAPVIVDDLVQRIMAQVAAAPPVPPANAGIRFAER